MKIHVEAQQFQLQTEGAQWCLLLDGELEENHLSLHLAHQRKRQTGDLVNLTEAKEVNSSDRFSVCGMGKTFMHNFVQLCVNIKEVARDYNFILHTSIRLEANIHRKMKASLSEI